MSQSGQCPCGILTDKAHRGTGAPRPIFKERPCQTKTKSSSPNSTTSPWSGCTAIGAHGELRRPIFESGLDRWRNDESRLDPLKEALGEGVWRRFGIGETNP